MARRNVVILLVLLVFSLSAGAKDKKTFPLPVDVLKAKTVLVIVDPAAGVDAQDPTANRLARVDVEQALEKWGRFTLVQEGYTADLILMVRKGNGKFVQPTISGTPANGIPPVSAGSTSTPDESTTRESARWGHPAGGNDPSNAGTQPTNPQPQVEAGPSQDSFLVYRGNRKPRTGHHSTPRQFGGIPGRTPSSPRQCRRSTRFAKRSPIRRSNSPPRPEGRSQALVVHILSRPLEGKVVHMNRTLEGPVNVRDGHQRQGDQQRKGKDLQGVKKSVGRAEHRG